MRANDPEFREQSLYFELLSTQFRRYPELRWVHAIPNGAYVGMAQAQKLKQEGRTAGVSDVFAPFLRGGFGGLYLEFKRPKDPFTGAAGGKPSPEQKEFLAFALAEGYLCALVDNAQVAYKLTGFYVSHKLAKLGPASLLDLRGRRSLKLSEVSRKP